MARHFTSDKLTPLDFDNFLPWMCRQWQVPTIVMVTRIYQEEYVKQENRRSKSSYSKSINYKSIKFKHSHESDLKNNTKLTATTLASVTSDGEPAIPVVAYYDNRNNLVEISIICNFQEVHPKIIQAINVCVPFHNFLNKLTINKGGATYSTIHEISKLLPHSNLTEVCLDNSCVPEGNYFVLLDKKSLIKSLSLNRCDINDLICKEIATRISFDGAAHLSLVILELGSNLITDVGCQHIANVLRRNHRLLHLNLAGNKIGDIGMKSLLEAFMEFQLSDTELLDSRLRKIDYLRNKEQIFKICTDDALKMQKAEEPSLIQINNKKTMSVKSFKASRKSKKNIVIQEHSINEQDETLAEEIIDQHEDPFATVNLLYRNGAYFSLGNMGLCSLNLAYNELTYRSVKLLEIVLKYQSNVLKTNKATGLMRVNLDGNFIPKYCIEYEMISMMLKKVVNDNIPLPLIKPKRTQSTFPRKLI